MQKDTQKHNFKEKIVWRDFTRSVIFYWPAAEPLADAWEPLGYAESRLKITDVINHPDQLSLSSLCGL